MRSRGERRHLSWGKIFKRLNIYKNKKLKTDSPHRYNKMTIPMDAEKLHHPEYGSPTLNWPASDMRKLSNIKEQMIDYEKNIS